MTHSILLIALSFCMGCIMAHVTLSLLYLFVGVAVSLLLSAVLLHTKFFSLLCLFVWAVLWHTTFFSLLYLSIWMFYGVHHFEHCCGLMFELYYVHTKLFSAVFFCMGCMYYGTTHDSFHCCIFMHGLYYGTHHAFHCCTFLYGL